MVGWEFSEGRPGRGICQVRWDDGEVRRCRLLLLVVGREGKSGWFIVAYYSAGGVVYYIVYGFAPMVVCR